jgi:hypothetical protein
MLLPGPSTIYGSCGRFRPRPSIVCLCQIIILNDRPFIAPLTDFQLKYKDLTYLYAGSDTGFQTADQNLLENLCVVIQQY